MNYIKTIGTFAALLILALAIRVNAAELDTIVAALRKGNLVMVIRHTATDDSQTDIYPFRFDDMKAQRQLSDAGREAARNLGIALKKLGIPLGEIYTSKLNRAVEAGKLISGKDVQTREELTDSGAGSASSMANPSGRNAKVRAGVQLLVNMPFKVGTNNILVTHKTNIADAFGKEFSDVKEGKTLVFRPVKSGQPTLVARVLPSQWEMAAQK